jgi:hypothetical protein
MRHLVIVAMAACTSAAPGMPGPADDFTPADTISAVVVTSDGEATTTSSGHIVIGSTSDLCADATASPPVDRKNQRLIVIDLTDINGAFESAPTTAGTYTIYSNTGTPPPNQALLVTTELDGSCQSYDDGAASGQSGTVTLASVTNGVFQGTYDVMLNTGDHITGSFAPQACPAMGAALASTAPHSCQ